MSNVYDIAVTRQVRSVGKPRRARRYSRFAPELLAFFATHRTALATQMQRRFAEHFTSERSARMHLQTLAAAGELTIRRTEAPRCPNVYSISRRGLRRAYEFMDGVAARRVAQRRHPTASHLVHELLVTELAVSVAVAVRGRADLAMHWEERFGFVGQAAFTDMVPDYGFLFAHGRGRLCCLAEVSSGEDSATRLRQKLEKYAAWVDSVVGKQFLMDLYGAHGAHTPRPQFRLLVLAHSRTGSDTTRQCQVFDAAVRLPRRMLRRVWGTTAAELQADTSVDAPVWVRGADLESAAPTWQGLPRRQQQSRLTAAVAAATRHRLFPPQEAHGDDTAMAD